MILKKIKEYDPRERYILSFDVVDIYISYIYFIEKDIHRHCMYSYHYEMKKLPKLIL